MRLIDATELNGYKFGLISPQAQKLFHDTINNAPTVDAIPRENIKPLGEELRKVREGITDEKVLIGFNMAIAICNKYLGESEVQDEKIS